MFVLAGGAAASDRDDHDFGHFRDHLLAERSEKLFGIDRPLAESSTASLTAAEAEASPAALAKLARGLRARVVSAAANLGPNIDMMVLWPDDWRPTHLIACNEQGPTAPGVQRVSLSDGSAETILTGTSSCDPVRRTPWGTVLVGEEVGGTGHLLEIIDPLNTTGVVFDRVTGQTSGPGAANVVDRTAPGRLAWEGIALYPNAVMYYGDERRPSRGTAGGSYYKFVPDSPWTGGGPIHDLSESPLAAGKVYVLRVGRNSGNTDWGQGTSSGQGVWVELPGAAGADLAALAAAQKITGYYRPEDIDIDGAALEKGSVRFCGNNTGNEGADRYWGEAICITDGTLGEATAGTAVPEVQPFVLGTPELAMMDNMTYQEERGNWILHEDGDGPEVGRNNDLWSCLEDGGDEDSLSDGCVRVASLNDLTAEWTGGIFDARGRHFYVSVQHNVTGHGVILAITGWR
jgi:secreted PhoX family phosphatase